MVTVVIMRHKILFYTQILVTVKTSVICKPFGPQEIRKRTDSWINYVWICLEITVCLTRKMKGGLGSENYILSSLDLITKQKNGGLCEGKRNHLFNKIQDILIINKFNVAPINLLFCVFFLFHLEYVLKVTTRQSKVKKSD